MVSDFEVNVYLWIYFGKNILWIYVFIIKIFLNRCFYDLFVVMVYWVFVNICWFYVGNLFLCFIYGILLFLI